jgi:hypothetical protein
MPVLGTGIIPATGAVASELTALTRRAFIPKLVVQIYKSTPTLAALIASAQTASGGISSITQPVQGASYVNNSWAGYNGNFQQPSTQVGAQNAEFNLKLSIVPIPFLGLEGIVQMGHEVIPIVEARMNDAMNVIKDAFATALFNNIGATNADGTSNSQALGSLPAYADDGTNARYYGNLDRQATGPATWWKSYYQNYGVITTPTRAQVMTIIAGATKYAGGEAPNIGIMGWGTWIKLAQDFLGQERYIVDSGFSMGQVETGFRALMVSGVPIFPDPYMTEGELLLLNTNYVGLHFHEAASFSFTGFESTLPNMQLGYVGAVVTIAELVGSKPKTTAHIKNLSYESL